MKKYIKNSIIIASCALVFSACDDNAWNDKLDGFEENGYTDVKTIEYTLTDADYSAIASNSVNQALAGEDKAPSRLSAQTSTSRPKSPPANMSPLSSTATSSRISRSTTARL